MRLTWVDNLLGERESLVPPLGELTGFDAAGVDRELLVECVRLVRVPVPVAVAQRLYNIRDELFCI